MTVRTNIAAGLKQARKNAGMSVEEVGKALGKSGKTISAWEVGRGQPDGDELIILCGLLGAHLRDFYGHEYDDLVTSNEPLTETESEAEILDLYRQLTDKNRSILIAVAQAMLGH